MKAKQRIQPAFNDEMSFTDIIQFLILNTRVITTFVILGALLGGLYGQFSKPIYNGSILLAPAKISGALIENPQKTMSIFKAKYSHLSKETNLSCPLDVFKNINFNNPDNSNFSILKEINLIKISMQSTDETTINNCLNQTADEISLSQNKIAQPLIDFKKNQITATENKLKILTELGNQIDIQKIKEINTNKATFKDDLLYANIIQNNISEIRLLNEWSLKNKQDIVLDDLAHKVSGVNIERKPFPSFKYGAFFGLLLGFGLGLLIALMRQIKVSLSF